MRVVRSGKRGLGTTFAVINSFLIAISSLSGKNTILWEPAVPAISYQAYSKLSKDAQDHPNAAHISKELYKEWMESNKQLLIT